jgi:hypothetical protein
VQENCQAQSQDCLKRNVEDDVLERHLQRIPELRVPRKFLVVVQPDELRRLQQAVFGQAEIEAANGRPEEEDQET